MARVHGARARAWAESIVEEARRAAARAQEAQGARGESLPHEAENEVDSGEVDSDSIRPSCKSYVVKPNILFAKELILHL